jgi:hypothetical protein
VTHHFLHDPQVGPIPQEKRGHCMSDHVRG